MNEFLVGVQGDRLVFLIGCPCVLTKEQALNLAAVLATLADPTGEEFQKRLSEFQAS